MRAFVAWVAEDGENLYGPVEWHNSFLDALPAVGDTISGASLDGECDTCEVVERHITFGNENEALWLFVLRYSELTDGRRESVMRMFKTSFDKEANELLRLNTWS